MAELTITSNDFDRDELHEARSVEFTGGAGVIRVDERDLKHLSHVVVSGRVEVHVSGALRANVRVTDVARLRVSTDVGGNIVAEGHAHVTVKEAVSGRVDAADTAEVNVENMDLKRGDYTGRPQRGPRSRL